MQVFSPVKNFLLFLGLALVLAGASHAAPLRVDQENSVFAIVTHKAGLARGQAHNHLITAGSYSVTMEGEVDTVGGAVFEPAAFEIPVFEIDLAANDLVIDEPGLQEQWYPRLEALGILSEAFADVAQKDRDKIRQSALGRSQLDADKFPRIQARVKSITEKNSTLGEVDLSHEVLLSMEVHGQIVERPVAAKISWEEGRLRVEAAGVFQFTDFDIEPYSAFFGAVRNTDEFHVYVNLTATP